MYAYTIDGSILTLVVTGATTSEHRESMLSAIRQDSRVPNGALLLIDARQAASVGSTIGLQERAHTFVHLLGPKMGPLCAIIVPPDLAAEAALFQAAGGELGVRVGLFAEESQAKQWLHDFRAQISSP
jgi:hypothetical protein